MAYSVVKPNAVLSGLKPKILPLQLKIKENKKTDIRNLLNKLAVSNEVREFYNEICNMILLITQCILCFVLFFSPNT